MATCMVGLFFINASLFLAVGEQLLKSQSADSFLNVEMDTGVSSAPQSHSWLSTINSSQREMDTVSSHGPHMQDAFLSPLFNKGRLFLILSLSYPFLHHPQKTASRYSSFLMNAHHCCMVLSCYLMIP